MSQGDSSDAENDGCTDCPDNNTRFHAALIEKIKEYPSLYDTRCIAYRDMHSKGRTWLEISDSLQSIAPGVNSTVCRKRWASLKRRFLAERGLIKNRSSGCAPHISKWPFFPAMDFLHPYIEESINKNACPIQENVADNGVMEGEPSSSTTSRKRKRDDAIDGLVAVATQLLQNYTTKKGDTIDVPGESNKILDDRRSYLGMGSSCGQANATNMTISDQDCSPTRPSKPQNVKDVDDLLSTAEKLVENYNKLQEQRQVAQSSRNLLDLRCELLFASLSAITLTLTDEQLKVFVLDMMKYAAIAHDRAVYGFSCQSQFTNSAPSHFDGSMSTVESALILPANNGNSGTPSQVLLPTGVNPTSVNKIENIQLSFDQPGGSHAGEGNQVGCNVRRRRYSSAKYHYWRQNVARHRRSRCCYRGTRRINLNAVDRNAASFNSQQLKVIMHASAELARESPQS